MDNTQEAEREAARQVNRDAEADEAWAKMEQTFAESRLRNREAIVRAAEKAAFARMRPLYNLVRPADRVHIGYMYKQTSSVSDGDRAGAYVTFEWVLDDGTTLAVLLRFYSRVLYASHARLEPPTDSNMWKEKVAKLTASVASNSLMSWRCEFQLRDACEQAVERLKEAQQQQFKKPYHDEFQFFD